MLQNLSSSTLLNKFSDHKNQCLTVGKCPQAETSVKIPFWCNIDLPWTFYINRHMWIGICYRHIPTSVSCIDVAFKKRWQYETGSQFVMRISWRELFCILLHPHSTCERFLLVRKCKCTDFLLTMTFELTVGQLCKYDTLKLHVQL